MTGFIRAERSFTMMNKRLAVCICAVLLTACASGNAQSADTEISADNITVSETEIASDNVTVSETEDSEPVTETEMPIVTETPWSCVTEPVTETEMTIVTETPWSCVTQPVPKTYSDHRDAYRAKLAEIAEDENSSVPAFDLMDMDGDGIPELFVSYADHHAAGAFIFTYKDGELLPVVCTETPSGEQSFFGSYGQVCASSDGYVRSSYFGMGVGLDSFYGFDGKTLTLIASTEQGSGCIYDEDGSPVPDEYYMINGRDVSAEEYNAVFDENYAHDWKELGRGHFIDETADKIIYGE